MLNVIMKQEGKNETKIDSSSDLRLLDYQSKKFFKQSNQLFKKLSLQHTEIKQILEYFQSLQSTLLIDGKKFYQKLLNCQTFIELFNEKKLQIKNKQISHLSNVNELQKLLKDIEDMLTEYKQEERMISNNLPSEINEFQNFLDKHGGRTGGWSIDEHTKFLKHLKLYKHQCKNALNNHENNQNDKINIHQQNNETKDEIQQQTIKNDDTNKHTTINTTTSDSNSSSSSSSSVVSYNISTFHQEFANIIMNKTPEEVAEHEKWWKEFQRLENAKRVLFKSGVKKNDYIQPTAIVKCDWEDEKTTDETSSLQYMSRRKEYQKKNNTDDDNNDTVEIKHNSYAKQQHLSMEQLEARRVELELWRQQRQEMKKQEEELKRQAEIQLKNAQLELKRKRQAKIQQKISLYKQEKMAEKLATLQSLALQTKMEQLNRQAEINKAASRIQQRTTIQVTRDPKRLCQLTKGWKLRLAQPKIDNLVNQGLDLSVNTGRMIPKWRRNL
ncbi:Coiled-coil domain-containing protein [Schistosoma japonicum]|uniref:Coiled-coil domain-containing protein n=1 Tax=Schistosoma japonicum TaxID=6182 RepID=A0A4Z2DCL5_SCHJA|nr:Coiled-coil domain-containing protein [Schistosoma japonicum]